MKESPKNTQVWADWFKLQITGPEMSRLIETASDFALDFKEQCPARWLTILGGSGNGKTHTGERLWAYMRPRVDWARCSFTPSKIYWPRFVAELRSGDVYEKMRDLWKWPVLFLDDVFSERDKDGFSIEQLNTLLGVRENKWTIITSNKSLEQIAKVEPRIADRMIRQPNKLINLKLESYSLGHRKNTTLPYID